MKLTHLGLVKEMIDLGYINVRKHPEFDLYIYNYSKLTEFEHVWNDATELCRGIICDKDMNVVARPFVKFYNYEEIVNKIDIPKLPFEVSEKLDGSLGIMYWFDDKPYITTRGSFDSEQAKHATKVLYDKYADKFHLLDKSKTYLFEIIYKDNDTRLVVDYGDTDDIFLIGVIDTDTGKEDNIYDWKHIFKTTTIYKDVDDYMKFRDMSDGKNREGFVIKFANGFRMKLKFADYFAIHSLMCHLTDKKVCDCIINGTIHDMKTALASMSEECQIYFDSIYKSLLRKFDDIDTYCKSVFKVLDSDAATAQYLASCDYPGVLFAMKNNQDYSKVIWKHIRKSL